MGAVTFFATWALLQEGSDAAKVEDEEPQKMDVDALEARIFKLNRLNRYLLHVFFGNHCSIFP